MIYKEAKLGDYIDILSGFAFKTKDFVAKGVPIIKIKNISPPSVTLDDLTYVSYEIAEKQKKFILSYDDVLIAMTGSHINQWASVVGRVARVKYNDKTLLNQRVGKITIKENVEADINYIYYFLSQDEIKIKLAAKAGGAANQANISPTHIKELNFPCPNYDTQKKIANILKSYDDLIENSQKQIKLLEEAAQRLYKEWFVDLHFPGYENVKIVDGVPEGWLTTTVDSFIKLQSGYAFKSNSFDNTGKYKIVTIKNVQDGAFDEENVNRIIEIPSKMPPHCKLNEGDTLLSLTGNVGRICTVIGDNYLLNQRVAKIVSDYPCYAYYLFRSKKMFHDMNNLANGAAQQNLSPIRTGQMQILKPSDDILLMFEEMAKSLMYKKILLNKSIVTAKQARDRLLPKLMSGEIEV